MSGGNPRLQRMRRSDGKSIAIFTGFAFFDPCFTIVYLEAAAMEDEIGFEIANEIISTMPNLLPRMRLTGPQGAIALAAVDLVAAVVSTGLGGKILADDLKEVRAAA